MPSVFSSAETEPLLAERGDAHGFERGFVAGGGDRVEDVGFELGDVGHDSALAHLPWRPVADHRLRDLRVAPTLVRSVRQRPRCRGRCAYAVARGFSAGERGLGLLDDGLERRRLVDGEIGQHLAVDR